MVEPQKVAGMFSAFGHNLEKGMEPVLPKSELDDWFNDVSDETLYLRDRDVVEVHPSDDDLDVELLPHNFRNAERIHSSLTEDFEGMLDRFVIEGPYLINYMEDVPDWYNTEDSASPVPLPSIDFNIFQPGKYCVALSIFGHAEHKSEEDDWPRIVYTAEDIEYLTGFDLEKQLNQLDYMNYLEKTGDGFRLVDDEDTIKEALTVRGYMEEKFENEEDFLYNYTQMDIANMASLGISFYSQR